MRYISLKKRFCYFFTQNNPINICVLIFFTYFCNYEKQNNQLSIVFKTKDEKQPNFSVF